jgi:hypothetical protein
MTAAETTHFLKIPSTEKVERYDIAFLKAIIINKIIYAIKFSIARIAGSNSAEYMNVRLLSLLCIV